VPISSCGFRLDDEAVRIGVGLRLDLTLCVPHKCHCGALVDAQGLHGFVCKKALGRPARHHALNDLVTRAMMSAGIPCTEEPLGLSRSDVKRPDGLSLVPWEAGKPLTWDVWYGMVSHTRTVVRECYKGNDESQWEMGKFDPPPPKNPLTDGHQNFCR